MAGYEVDFIHVGTGEKNGDAIAVRYGEPNAYKVIVYDGGTKASGEALVEHIEKVYGTTHVDYVVNSHLWVLTLVPALRRSRRKKHRSIADASSQAHASRRNCSPATRCRAP